MKKKFYAFKNIGLIIFLAVILLNFSSFVTSYSDEKPILAIRILNFESPVRLGDFMNFEYHLRSVSGINDPIRVNFDLEKNEKIISSGSDIIYIVNTQNKTITTKVFLPSNLESGVYKLRINANHENYSVESYRIIEMGVKKGFASISLSNMNLKTYIILILLIIPALFIITFIYEFERKKIKEVLIKEKKFIKKYRLCILTLGIFLILGLVTYYLKLINVLRGVPTYFYYSFLGILLLLISMSISSKKRHTKNLAIRKKKRKK